MEWNLAVSQLKVAFNRLVTRSDDDYVAITFRVMSRSLQSANDFWETYQTTHSNMIQLDETPAGIVLPVKAQPGARRNAVVGEHAGALKVAVTQVPEKGKANDAILDVLTKSLDLKRSQLELISGATSSQKKFLVTGISATDLELRIGRLLKQ